MDKNGKITIIDVARKAGVSKGTVDRVVHNRGEVSKKSAEKVKKAIEELRYQPNLYASLLASKKAHVIACLLPTFGKESTGRSSTQVSCTAGNRWLPST